MRCISLIVFTAVILAMVPVLATTILVPSQQPTIQAGINFAGTGDTVLIADGTYTGTGNRDIDFNGKAIVVRSASGNPELCVIDCQGSSGDPHRAFVFQSLEGRSTMLEGVTITNGYASLYGGGIYCAAQPTIRGCVFSNNDAGSGGGAIGMETVNTDCRPLIVGCTFQNNFEAIRGQSWNAPHVSNAVIDSCVFAGNSGWLACDILYWGGNHVYYDTVRNCAFHGSSGLTAMRFQNDQGASWMRVINCTFTGYAGGFHIHKYGTAYLTNCSFVGNSNSGVSLNGKGTLDLENCIIAFTSSGPAVEDWSSYRRYSISAACCDMYGNSGGDYVGPLAGWEGVDGNFSLDPLFCDTANSDFHIQTSSPCAPANNDCAVLIGALGVGCASIPVAFIDNISPNPADAGELVSFSGHGTDDGTITGYAWRSHKDGELSTQPSFSTSTLSTGYHTIYFKVKDDDENWSEEVSAQLQIGYPPIANAGGPYSAEAWEVINFDGTASSDPGGSIVQYDWKFSVSDDWHEDIGPTPSTMYGEDGEFTVTLRVHDNSGLTDSAQVTVSITTPVSSPPIAYIDYITPNPALEGQAIQFSGHGKDVYGETGTIVAYHWRTDAIDPLSTSASFSTASLPVGIHTVYFKVKLDNDLWSNEISQSLIVSAYGEYGVTVITAPYWEGLTSEGGTGIFAITHNMDNVGTGAIGAFASAGFIGGVFSEAWQTVILCVRNEKVVMVDGQLTLAHGAPTYGAAGFAGTAGLAWWDANHDGEWPWDERAKDYIDPPFSAEAATDMVIDLLIDIGEAIIPGANIAEVFEVIRLMQLLDQLLDLLHDLAELGDASVHHMTFAGTMEPALHRIGIGVRAEASACVTGTGIAMLTGAVENIRVTGIYPPGPPVVNGPASGFGYVGDPCWFTALADDINGDSLQYRFDWDDGTEPDYWTHVYHADGDAQSTVHVFFDNGEYEVKAQTQDGEGYQVLDGWHYMISDWSSPYTVVIGEGRPVTVTGYCPIDLVVTDPSGAMVNSDTSEIEYATYVVADLNGDGDPDRQIFIPFGVEGEYQVEVIPDSTAQPTDSFSLYIACEDDTTVLAEDVVIEDIPEDPYTYMTYVCGDIDNNGSGPDIADLVYLVIYMFQGGPQPPVMEACDIDGNGTPVPDIADLVYLVTYMFQDGPPLQCGGVKY